MRRYQILGFRL